jgi:hypothetical protein
MDQIMRYFRILLFLSLSSVILSPACKPVQTEEIGLEEVLPIPTLDQIRKTSQKTSTPTVSAEKVNPLHSDPLDVVFFSEDDVEIKGRFFPSAYLDQPVIILMHWYQGDQRGWEEIAYWLQNRGNNGIQAGAPWLDPSWFPTLPSKSSYNVLTFTFRNCDGGCSQPTHKDWLLDARASLEAVRSLEGVDPDRVITIGASIGGDAAISSCLDANKGGQQFCLGTLSFSPGSYLGESYPDLVTQLGRIAPPRPAWCFYDRSDPNSDVCQVVDGNHFRAEGWQGGNLHGMHLITSTLEPLPLSLLVDFIEMVIESDINS